MQDRVHLSTSALIALPHATSSDELPYCSNTALTDQEAIPLTSIMAKVVAGLLALVFPSRL